MAKTVAVETGTEPCNDHYTIFQSTGTPERSDRSPNHAKSRCVRIGVTLDPLNRFA